MKTGKKSYHQHYKVIKKKYPRRSLCILVAIFCSLLLMFVHQTNKLDNLTAKLLLVDVDQHSVDESMVDSTKNYSILQAKARRLPQVIIIGARKSGTRALVRFLELNPSIKAARNEVHFFDKLQNFKRGLDWYRGQMPETTPGELTIEKSPAYFVTPKAPARIKAMNSTIKLVLIVRNPVTRLISDFSQLIANRVDRHNNNGALSASEDYETRTGGDDYYYQSSLMADRGAASGRNQQEAGELIWQEAEKEFEQFVLRPDGGIDDQRPAVRIGMYSSHLERWLASFKRHQLHLVDGERLIERPHEELNKLELFLNLKPVIRGDQFVFEPRKGFYCLSSGNKTQLKKLDESAEVGVAVAPICLSKSKGRRHVKVASHLRQQLEQFYAPYNEYFFALTGINLINSTL